MFGAKKVLAGIVLSVISGIMIAFSFSPFNQWYLIFFSFIPLIVAQYWLFPGKHSSIASSIANALWVGIIFGPMFFFIEGAPWYMKGLPALVFALNYVTEKKLRIFSEKTRYRWFVIQGVVGWVSFEFIRTLIPGLGTWGFIGYTLWDQLWLIQPVSIVGIYGLNALIILINYTLGLATLKLLDKGNTLKISKKGLMAWGAVSIFFSVVWISVSIFQYTAEKKALTNRSEITVAAIQPGTTTVAFNDPDMNKEERLAILVNMTREAAKSNPDLIVWPELVLSFDPEEEFLMEIKELATEVGAYISVPYGILGDDGSMRNEVKFISPSGNFSSLYAKTHPVLFAGERYGPNVGTYPVQKYPEGNFANMICYDLNYTDVMRKLSVGGAEVVAVPANDWPGIAEKQNPHLAFRAIEGRAAIVNAESAYDSAIVTSLGEIVEQTQYLEPTQEILIATIPLGSAERTLYTYIGDSLGWIIFIAGIFFMFFPDIYLKRIEKATQKK